MIKKASASFICLTLGILLLSQTGLAREDLDRPAWQKGRTGETRCGLTNTPDDQIFGPGVTMGGIQSIVGNTKEDLDKIASKITGVDATISHTSPLNPYNPKVENKRNAQQIINGSCATNVIGKAMKSYPTVEMAMADAGAGQTSADSAQ
jgi:hypothetical protein